MSSTIPEVQVEAFKRYMDDLLSGQESIVENYIDKKHILPEIIMNFKKDPKEFSSILLECTINKLNALKEVNTEDEYDVYVEKFTVIAEFYESIIAVPGLHVRAPIVPELVSFLLSDFHRWTPNQNLAIIECLISLASMNGKSGIRDAVWDLISAFHTFNASYSTSAADSIVDRLFAKSKLTQIEWIRTQVVRNRTKFDELWRLIKFNALKSDEVDLLPINGIKIGEFTLTSISDCDWSIEINLTRKSISFSFDATNSNQDVSRPAVAVIESHIIQNVQTGMTDDATVTPLLLTLNEAPCVSIEDVQTWLNDERQVKVQLRCTAEAFAELTATLNEWINDHEAFNVLEDTQSDETDYSDSNTVASSNGDDDRTDESDAENADDQSMPDASEVCEAICSNRSISNDRKILQRGVDREKIATIIYKEWCRWVDYNIARNRPGFSREGFSSLKLEIYAGVPFVCFAATPNGSETGVVIIEGGSKEKARDTKRRIFLEELHGEVSVHVSRGRDDTIFGAQHVTLPKHAKFVIENESSEPCVIRYTMWGER